MAEPAREQSESGRYRALLELGEGGTAKVYVAQTRDSAGNSELVVLKTLKSHLANEPELRDMFSAEAALSARLDHPNVVRVREVFEHGRSPVIAMEYLEGRVLSEIIQRAAEKLPLELHLWIIAEALRGLHYSHELTDGSGAALGVVHRDMTPHNVFATYRGRVKLLDFGIAKVNASSVETETGVIKGKVRYMAPEQITGDPIDRRTDLYSCGVMLWEAATGSKLWRGVGDTAVMSRVLAGEIPPPSSVRACPVALERVILKALSVAPTDRHATALDLLRDLEEAAPELRKVTEAQCGEFVRGLFAEDIRETRQRIEERLQDVDESGDEGKLSFPLTLSFNEGSAIGRRKNRTFSPGVVLSLALLGIAAFAVSALLWGPGEARPANVATVAVAPTRASVQLTAFPGEARLWLDDRALASNPATVELTPSVPHRVRAEAPGYQATERELGQATSLVLKLEPAPPPAAAALPAPSADKPRAVTSAIRPPAKASATPSAGSCEPPFFYDARGVKKYKPDCL
ncbi:MAG TPA: serine/threonine-protein kinase [Polyangiaceae bacterium]|nr:serine/threonine-protein kinase [Polyangiaceae bacterium]